MNYDEVTQYASRVREHIVHHLQFHSFETRDGDFIAGVTCSDASGYLYAATDLFQEEAESFLAQQVGVDDMSYVIQVDQGTMTEKQRSEVNHHLEYSFEAATPEDAAQGYKYGSELRGELSAREREVIKAYHWMVSISGERDPLSVHTEMFSDLAQELTDASDQSIDNLVTTLRDKHLITASPDEATISLTARGIIGWAILNDIDSPLQSG